MSLVRRLFDPHPKRWARQAAATDVLNTTPSATDGEISQQTGLEEWKVALLRKKLEPPTEEDAPESEGIVQEGPSLLDRLLSEMETKDLPSAVIARLAGISEAEVKAARASVATEDVTTTPVTEAEGGGPVPEAVQIRLRTFLRAEDGMRMRAQFIAPMFGLTEDYIHETRHRLGLKKDPALPDGISVDDLAFLKTNEGRAMANLSLAAKFGTTTIAVQMARQQVREPPPVDYARLSAERKARLAAYLQSPQGKKEGDIDIAIKFGISDFTVSRVRERVAPDAGKKSVIVMGRSFGSLREAYRVLGEEHGLSMDALRKRIEKGKSWEEALAVSSEGAHPITAMGRSFRNTTEACRVLGAEYGLHTNTLLARVKKGMPWKEALTAPVQVKLGRNERKHSKEPLHSPPVTRYAKKTTVNVGVKTAEAIEKLSGGSAFDRMLAEILLKAGDDV
jgi:hypothetical protein